MSVPVITTAIPKRRYQLGDFLLTLLGDIESGDGIEYRYIMAVARESDPKPHLFVSAERGGEGADPLRLRVSMPDGEQVLGGGERWSDVDLFVDDALALVIKILGLSDEQPYQLD